MSDTAAVVNMTVYNNATWQDAFRFGTEGDTTWSFTGQKFILEVKGSSNDAAALLQLKSDDSEIVVDDAVERVLHLNVDDEVIRAALKVGEYVYDLVMYDTTVPEAIRVPLMRGRVFVKQGVSGE
jgi:hypothetical protein